MILTRRTEAPGGMAVEVRVDIDLRELDRFKLSELVAASIRAACIPRPVIIGKSKKK
jgi:hypothetical protein